jgi:hypothetical protein
MSPRGGEWGCFEGGRVVSDGKAAVIRVLVVYTRHAARILYA